MDCPRCQKPLPAEFAQFTHIERVMRGKSEKCPSCNEAVWIPLEGAPETVVRIAEHFIPMMADRKVRRTARFTSLA
jgi:hypothetical protein